MNEQLNELLRILDDHDISYWLEDGTLLGYIRESSLLESDRDIDIAIHVNSLSRFGEAISDFENLSYNSYYISYKGVPLKYKMESVNYDRTVDFQIKRPAGEHLWTLAAYTSKIDRPSSRVRSYLWRAYNALCWFYFRNSIEIKDHFDSGTTYAKNLMKTFDHWISLMPRKFSGLTQTTDRLIQIPSNPKEYLSYKYGSWKTPTSEWNYLEDDGSVVNKDPGLYL